MPERCIPVRCVKLRFVDRATKKVRVYRVMYPARWTKGNVLASARTAHPDQSVKILEWGAYGNDPDHPFEPIFWLVSPRKIADYSPEGKKRMEPAALSSSTHGAER